jgi:glycosyltransferase involved in cell wall biosynthesis
MDDCSPDNTLEVAGSFTDPRVHYIRNEQNLGHLRNYNKGIELSRGKYVWLISADDRLRRPYLLERYVRLMEDNPRVGYACCPALKLENGIETVIDCSLAKNDRVFAGKDFLMRLLNGNRVIAASGIVRRTCYEKHGMFPLDLPYTGDWFLWCLFALYHDVAYFAEPMVNYRSHELSMTNYLMANRVAASLREGFLVLTRIRNEVDQTGDVPITKHCRSRLISLYGIHLADCKYENVNYYMTEEEFEARLAQDSSSSAEKNYIRVRAWEAAGDWSFRLQKFAEAEECYKKALEHNGWMVNARAKQCLLRAGTFGSGFRRLLQLRNAIFK